MKLTISLPTVIGEKLYALAQQELRPIALQAEYMLTQAIKRARLKPSEAGPPQEQRPSRRPEAGR